MSKKLYSNNEDQDLIERLNSVGEPSTGTAFTSQQFELNKLQIEATLRNTKKMVDLDESNIKLTKYIGSFAIIQIFIAGLQLIGDLDSLSNKLSAFFLGALFIVGLYYFTFKYEVS